jgi:predicted metalloprotease with PDZ domain
MRLHILTLSLALIWLSGCSTSKKSGEKLSKSDAVKVSIDLVNVESDQVKVTVTAPRQTASTVAYHFPKIIPGTYAIADYGRYVTDIKAFDKNEKELKTTRTDSNTVTIEDAKRLAKISYLVNDTFDNEADNGTFTEEGKTIFSPAGTNIDAGKQFMLNMAGFVGYFTDQLEKPYQISISHPDGLYGSTALIDTDNSSKSDIFNIARYPDVVDNPIMYAAPDTSTFNVNGMEVLLGVYSKSGKVRASALRPDLERMVRAQKKFLGPINDTKKYAVLTYISSGAEDDAKGLGALEHNNSTTAVFRDPMRSKDLIHVISHEFFHTLTPLKVHSKEIQYFDFDNPKMSQHLWFYEGVTEYFSNLFQVNQGLINENQFYDLMAKKVENSRGYDDKLSITEMSSHVLDKKMKAQYPNVYEKGALIAMCLDILIREESNGERGLLWLMGELSKTYGPTKAFEDSELIPEITKLTSATIGAFLQNQVVRGEHINYELFTKKVGVAKEVVPFPEPIVFMIEGTPYIKLDKTNAYVLADSVDGANNFYNNLGIKNNDRFVEINGLKLDPKDLNGIVYMGYDLEEGSPITVKVNRNGQDLELKGTVKQNYSDGDGFRFKDESKRALNQAWLKK